MFYRSDTKLERISFYLAKIQQKLNIPAIRGSIIDKHARIASGCDINFLTIGRYSYVGKNAYIFKAKIGAFCSIADNCHIGAPGHPISFASTSPVFSKGRNTLGTNFANHWFSEGDEVIIENDVWIGAGVNVKSGIKIGTGVVIGMGSVVTHDVPCYEIWAGNPAKKIRDRFNEEIAHGLLELKWWELSDSVLYKYGEYFNDPVRLIELLKDKDNI